MNFEIAVNSAGEGTMTWDKPTNIETNVWWSFNVEKGSMFNNPEFGLQLKDIKKVTVGNLAIIQQRVEDSLRWLIDTGKATAIGVLVERDTTEVNRINWRANIVQANGIPVIVESFRTIGGPSQGFTL